MRHDTGSASACSTAARQQGSRAAGQHGRAWTWQRLADLHSDDRARQRLADQPDSASQISV
ncbi:MAG: hypothetical protein EOR07_03060 [Mesorhizobium sp.]|nr:MAG: hypothetical protein EOR07_03060 [Mesorhizobium sp.]